METQGHASGAEHRQTSLALSLDGGCASSAASENGTPPSRKRKKVRAYRCKKALTAEQVEHIQRLIGLSVDDFEEVKEKKKRAEDAPREPNQAAFHVFWGIYPRQDVIGAALKAWKNLQPDAATVGMILKDVRERCQSFDWKKDCGKWIPYAHTYLAHQRWLDKGIVHREIITRRTVI